MEFMQSQLDMHSLDIMNVGYILTTFNTFYLFFLVIFFCQYPQYSNKAKGKGHHRTGHEGPEVQQRYSSTLSLTSAVDGGGWSTPRPGSFTPGKDPLPIVQEAGWAPGPVWKGAENLTPLRDSIPGPTSPQRVTIPAALSQQVYRAALYLLRY